MNLSLRNILAILLLAAIIIYAATKGLIYYKFKNAVDMASAQMRIFATVRYDDITSSLLDKSVTVHGLSVLPSGFEDGFSIDTVTLQSQDIGFLLKGFDAKKGEFPERLNMTAKGFRLDLYGAMIDQVEQILNQLNEMTRGTMPATCGNKQFLGPADYREMGYDILDSDMELGYQFTGQGINITYEWVTRDVASALMLMKISGPTRPSRMAVMSNPPQINEISIAYQDLSYIKRANEYCARLSKQDVAQYIEKEVNKADKAYALQWGFIPGPGLKQAYKDFLSKPGTVKLTVRPPENFNQNTIGLYKAEDIPAMLNMELSINDQPVSDLSFRFLPAESSTAEDKEEVATLQDRISSFKKILQTKEDEVPVIQRPTKIKKGPPPRFHRVAIANLKQHKDQQVRVYTKIGIIRYGRLDQVTPNALHVSKDVHRGEFIMIIDKAEIAKVEALYVKN